MNFKPCIVIPCYEHGYALEELVSQVAHYGYPIIIINDGSSDTTAQVLDVVSARHHSVIAIHRPENGGKGSAVIEGLRRAEELGLTHGVCIDSDGQHDVSDIPQFIEAARRDPEALILGNPIFGPEAPWIRRIGREFSNVSMAVATLSLKVRDALCGFRVYPIAPLMRDVSTGQLDRRMGFDFDIVAQSVWAGLRVVNIPTRVCYPRGGVSHFKYGRDNLTLIRLEGRLIARGLISAPFRVVRGLWSRTTEAYKHWSQIPERGSVVGLRFLLGVFELMGRWPLMCILSPVMVYMFLFAGPGRRAAVDFQRQLLQSNGESASAARIYLRAFRQFWEFGSALVDRVLSWRNGIKRERFIFEGLEEFRSAALSSTGVIFMGAHVGNIEVIRAFVETRDIPVNALMFTKGSRKLHAFLEEVNPQTFLRVIEVSDVGSSLLFDLQARLSRGEIVAFLGDRVSIQSLERVCPVPFLGKNAMFPEGPWVLASFLDAPVYTGFCMRERNGMFRVEFKKLADRVELPRTERQHRLRAYMEEYAGRLEDIIRRYPFQWFNFFDFWQSELQQAARQTRKVVGFDA